MHLRRKNVKKNILKATICTSLSERYFTVVKSSVNQELREAQRDYLSILLI